MGILYQVMTVQNWAIWLFVLFSLMAFNEFSRSTKWGGLLMFLVLPTVLTIFVWPTTAAPGNEYGTGNWFVWVKTYSALAGCLGFMALRYIPGLTEKKWRYVSRPPSWRSTSSKLVSATSSATPSGLSMVPTSTISG